jgi:hypothetical protein
MDQFAIGVIRACSVVYLVLSIGLGFVALLGGMTTALVDRLTGGATLAWSLVALFFFVLQGVIVWAFLRVLAYVADNVTWLRDLHEDELAEERRAARDYSRQQRKAGSHAAEQPPL